MRDQRERRRDADCRDASEERLRGRTASLDARVSASAAHTRTTGVALRGRLRRFGVFHALLGGHLPHDERPGVHLAIEVALPLLRALLLAFLWCRHRSCLLVSRSQRYASVVLLYTRLRSMGLNRLVHRRAHGYSRQRLWGVEPVDRAAPMPSPRACCPRTDVASDRGQRPLPWWSRWPLGGAPLHGQRTEA